MGEKVCEGGGDEPLMMNGVDEDTVSFSTIH